MTVFIGNRIPSPEEWTQLEPGVWQLTYTKKHHGKPVLHRRVMYGNTQCLLCGEPIERHPGELAYCHECTHALLRYQKGTLRDKRYIRRIEEYLEIRPENSAQQKRLNIRNATWKVEEVKK